MTAAAMRPPPPPPTARSSLPSASPPVLLPRREFFVAGEPIEQMGDAAEIATSGEVVFSPAAAALLLPQIGMAHVLLNEESTRRPLSGKRHSNAGGGQDGTSATSSGLQVATIAAGTFSPADASKRLSITQVGTPANVAGDGRRKGWASTQSEGRLGEASVQRRRMSADVAPPTPIGGERRGSIFSRRPKPTANDLLDAKLRKGSIVANGFFLVATSSSANARPQFAVATRKKAVLGSLAGDSKPTRAMSMARSLTMGSNKRLALKLQQATQHSNHHANLATRLEDALRCFVPALVEERVEAGQQARLALYALDPPFTCRPWPSWGCSVSPYTAVWP